MQDLYHQPAARPRRPRFDVRAFPNSQIEKTHARPDSKVIPTRFGGPSRCSYTNGIQVYEFELITSYGWRWLYCYTGEVA